MQSIALALTWEMLRHGRWYLLAGVLGAIAFPVVLFAALERDGAIDPADPSFLIMHVVLMQVNMFVFGAAVMTAQGSPSRLFAYPASSSTIVTWHLLPAMLMMAMQSTASTAFLNAVFHLNWPVWGPALFVSVMLAGILAILWLLEKSAWLPVGVALVALALGIWFKSRYGYPFSMPERYWRTMAPAEVMTIGAATLLAYLGGLAAVTRNRRGEAPLSLGIIAWLARVLDAPPSNQRFDTAERAQFWFEWRQKGWALPATVGFGMFVGVSLWLIFNRDPEELFGGFVAGGGMLAVAALVGALVVGNTGPNDAASQMGSFLATRPMTTPDMARLILKTAAWSVGLAWLLWAAAFLVVYGVLLAIDRLPGDASIPWSWWYFPLSLLVTWIVMAVGASIGMTGRPYFLVKTLCGLLAAYIVAVIVAGHVLSDQEQMLLGRAATVAVSVFFLIGTAWAFVAARRRILIGAPTLYVAASIWMVLTAIVVLIWVSKAPAPVPVALLLIGLASLAVAPLATAPLALAWNRNR